MSDNTKFQKILSKHKTHLIGKYNSSVYICPDCNTRLIKGSSLSFYGPEKKNIYDSVYDHIIGFSNSNIGTVAIVECPECFTKWFFHGNYTLFKIAIENGTQKHFKS